MSRDQIVFERLVQSGNEGITGHDFPKVVNYRDAISRLRKQGHNILMVKERDTVLKRNIGRYFYRGKAEPEPKVKAKRKETAGQIAKRLIGDRDVPYHIHLDLIQIYNLIR